MLVVVKWLGGFLGGVLFDWFIGGRMMGGWFLNDGMTL